jgi:hypothetical protein
VEDNTAMHDVEHLERNSRSFEDNENGGGVRGLLSLYHFPMDGCL